MKKPDKFLFVVKLFSSLASQKSHDGSTEPWACWRLGKP